MNLHLNHLQHIGIPVTDLSRSIQFYEQLGFANVMESEFDHKGQQGRVVMMQQKSMTLELYQFPENELQEIRSRRDGHIDHIAFDVDDIDATFAMLKKAAFQILEEAPVFLPFWQHGCRYFNIAGPDGERVEFNQILKN